VGGVPGVVGDLLDLEQGTVSEDPLLDGAVVDDIAGCGLDEALPGSQVVRYPIALGALAEVLLRREVGRQHGRNDPGEALD
jgi:hypothetical protein